MSEISPLSPIKTVVKLFRTPLNELPQILQTPISDLPIILNTPAAERASRIRARRTKRKGGKAAPPRQFVLEGTLVAGKSTKFAVQGEDLYITSSTWVFGELTIGSEVTVSGVIKNGGQRHALRIAMADPSFQ